MTHKTRLIAGEGWSEKPGWFREICDGCNWRGPWRKSAFVAAVDGEDHAEHPDDRHDPRCMTKPCTCPQIARRVRDADAKRARAISDGTALIVRPLG